MFSILRINLIFLIGLAFFGLLLGVFFAKEVPQKYSASTSFQFQNLPFVSSGLLEYQAGIMERIKIAIKSPSTFNATERELCVNGFSAGGVISQTKQVKVKLINVPSQVGLYDLRVEAGDIDIAKKCLLEILEIIKSEKEASDKIVEAYLQTKIDIYQGALGESNMSRVNLKCGNNILCQFKLSDSAAAMTSDYVKIKLAQSELKYLNINITDHAAVAKFSNIAFKIIISAIGFFVGLVVGMVILYIKYRYNKGTSF